MTENPTPHLSFVVRCRRDASGEIQGWLVDVYSGRSHPFRSTAGLVKSIDSILSGYSLLGEDPSTNDEENKEKG
jgi:hypothetical protein